MRQHTYAWAMVQLDSALAELMMMALKWQVPHREMPRAQNLSKIAQVLGEIRVSQRRMGTWMGSLSSYWLS
jgi:hypothetical protein